MPQKHPKTTHLWGITTKFLIGIGTVTLLWFILMFYYLDDLKSNETKSLRGRLHFKDLQWFSKDTDAPRRDPILERYLSAKKNSLSRIKGLIQSHMNITHETRKKKREWPIGDLKATKKGNPKNVLDRNGVHPKKLENPGHGGKTDENPEVNDQENPEQPEQGLAERQENVVDLKQPNLESKAKVKEGEDEPETFEEEDAKKEAVHVGKGNSESEKPPGGASQKSGTSTSESIKDPIEPPQIAENQYNQHFINKSVIKRDRDFTLDEFLDLRDGRRHSFNVQASEMVKLERDVPDLRPKE